MLKERGQNNGSNNNIGCAYALIKKIVNDWKKKNENN